MTRRLDFGAVSDSVWEAIFMLVVLKIPMIYLSVVVWYAVRAEPEPAAGGGDEVRRARAAHTVWLGRLEATALRARTASGPRPSRPRVRARSTQFA